MSDRRTCLTPENVEMLNVLMFNKSNYKQFHSFPAFPLLKRLFSSRFPAAEATFSLPLSRCSGLVFPPVISTSNHVDGKLPLSPSTILDLHETSLLSNPLEEPF